MSGDDWNVLSWHRDLAAAMRAQNFPLALQLANKSESSQSCIVFLPRRLASSPLAAMHGSACARALT